MSKPVVYLAHPVGAPTPAEILANLARARRWLRWLVEHTEWSIVASWMFALLDGSAALPDFTGGSGSL